MVAYTLGLDFGTNSVRALIVRCSDGEELATAVFDYPSGEHGILLDAKDPLLARQHPGDYLLGLERAVTAALDLARQADSTFGAEDVVGIGVDTTGSSPIPVDAGNDALAMQPRFTGDLAAQCWLWKDHTSHREAAAITTLARAHRPHYLAKIGGTYSAEWWWSKIWHCLQTAPAVFEAAWSWVELSDWIPAQLAGVTDPQAIRRGVCAAGHKALYAADWGGLPDEEFLGMLDPRLAALRDRLYQQAHDASQSAGQLAAQWAARLGLRAGIPIAIGEIDVHYGAVGCGVGEGRLVKVIGTSTCDCAVVSTQREIADIPGICGIVDGSILPGHFGVEAGQSAVGDLFRWWVEEVCEGDAALHGKLTAEAAQQRVGQHGLLALDWNNGNRNVLVDQRLTGLLLGTTLHTSRADIYRALLEATAFGARVIVERLVEYGVPVEQIVCAGGIAEKNALLMQIYADVLGREMRVSGSAQACALGAAVAAAVVAGEHANFASAQRAMTRLGAAVYRPDAAAHATYDRLFTLYRQLHDAFGGQSPAPELGGVMKALLELRDELNA